MGLRNPFRIEFNRETQELYIADYSPDANAPNPLRGPAGHGKWAVVTKAANFGWPYCATAELPYRDYNFATGQSGPAFNCATPVNQSPNNTGVTNLPPVTQPDVWYTYTAVGRVPRARDRWHRPDGRPGIPVQLQGGQGQESDRLAGVLRQRPALLRVDPRLHQGLLHRGRRRDADRERRALVHARPPDRHGVRAERVAVRPQLRQRLLRQEPAGRRTGADRLPRAEGRPHAHRQR